MEVESTSVSPPVCSSVNDAATAVKKILLLDRECVDLSVKLNITSMYSGVCSGMKDDDYPSNERLGLPLVSDVNRVPLPPELVEQFGHMQCNCIMGIFPEIGRAWLTVDSDIFVWRYADGDDLAYFDGLSETILSVALVQPKQGIFREHIKYLLVMTTPLDVIILGVSFAGEDVNNEMHLLPDPLFTLSSDGIYLLHTVGTDDGRIFTGGKDGCLYEISYQATGGWFSRKCTKINHSRSRLSFLLPYAVSVWLNEEDSICQLTVDDTRNILYTRSDKGTLTVYDLGVDGNDTCCVAQLRLDSIQRRSRDMAPGVEPSNFNELVYISPITLRESRFLHLVAVTQSGVRLYFMTCQSVTNNSPSAAVTDVTNLRPTGLHLVHVRLPPGFTGTTIQRPASLHSAHYNNGMLVLASSNGDDGTLWCINRDIYAFDNILRETQCNFPLDGRSWVIAEVSSPFSPLMAAALPSSGAVGLPPNPPIHVVQHIQKPSQYVVITSQGCHMFHKLRPVDQLRYLLESASDAESHAIEAFFNLYKNGEAACCCIILAISLVPTDRHITDRAIAAFMHYGGVAHNLVMSIVASPMMNPNMFSAVMSPIATGQQQQFSTVRTPGGLPVISTPMQGYNPPPPALPTHYQPTSTSSTAPTTAGGSGETPFLSERQHGLYKMFARMVRPLWEGNIVEDYVVMEGGKKKTFVISRVDTEVVSLVLNDLILLKTFISKHCMTQQITIRDYSTADRSIQRLSSQTRNSSNVQREIQKRQLAEAAATESSSIQYLHGLLHRSTEVLGLWRLLLHHQIHVLFEILDKQFQQSMKSMTFQDLILNGNALCDALISALVSQYLDDNATIDALSEQLREICPTLYSPDDAICSKASELLNIVRTTPESQRLEILQDAVRLFQQIGHSVNLPMVVQQLQAARYHTGAIELCIHAAQRRDEKGLALKLYKSALAASDPEVDPSFRKAYLARAECYKCATDTLGELMLAGESHPQAPSVPSQPGPPGTTQSGTGMLGGPLQPGEAQQLAESCLQLILRSDDELFHVTLYEWLLRRGLSNQLLKIASPFIESFLVRVAASQEETPSSLGAAGGDLLWQYYERNGNHMGAACILANLAEKEGSDKDLAKRIEYMSRAKMNAKSVTSVTGLSTTGGQLLHELEEKLEVAQLQLEISEQLKEMNEHESVMRLNSKLFDVTQLYKEYAEPFQLAECKLSIVCCAGLQDPTLVESLWIDIINQELSKQYSSEQTQASMLQMKLVNLGKKYLTSQRYFPVSFLAGYLENISCTRKWDTDWTINTILQSDFPLSDLLDIYGRLHEQKLPASQGFHFLFVINKLLNLFLDDPRKYVTSAQQRRHFVNRSLDVIAIHLVHLHSITSPSEEVQDLIAKFRRTQVSLEAMQDIH